MTSMVPDQAATQGRTLTERTVLVLGGSSGIGLATARTARAAGAEVILVGRDQERVAGAAEEVGAQRAAAFDLARRDDLDSFLESLPTIDHVLLTAGGPFYAPLPELDVESAQRHIGEHIGLILHLAKRAPDLVRPGGALLFVSGTGSRRPAVGISVTAALTAALPALAANLALELAPIRVNVLAPGFVDTPLSARLLGDALDQRRAELSATLPIRRVVQPEDVAALAVHVMTNTALTGATFDVDGGQQLM